MSTTRATTKNIVPFLVKLSESLIAKYFNRYSPTRKVHLYFITAHEILWCIYNRFLISIAVAGNMSFQVRCLMNYEMLNYKNLKIRLKSEMTKSYW